jgi:hypothetical protein
MTFETIILFLQCQDTCQTNKKDRKLIFNIKQFLLQIKYIILYIVEPKCSVAKLKSKFISKTYKSKL